MVDEKPWNLCKNPSNRWEILPLSYEFTFSVTNCILNNQEQFQTALSVHGTDTGTSQKAWILARIDDVLD